MLLEVRLYVKYESDKKTMKVPIEFVKGYKQINWNEDVDPNTLYEVFWSSDAEATPTSIEESQSKVINVDDAVKNATTAKERKSLQGCSGYYYARILAVKGHLKELDAYLDSKEGRRAVNFVVRDAVSGGSKGKDKTDGNKENDKSEINKVSKVKIQNLQRLGGTQSISRIVPTEALTVKRTTKRQRRDVLTLRDSDSDSDNDMEDESIMSVREHTEKIADLEATHKERYEHLKAKYNGLKAKYQNLYDNFMQCHGANLALQEQLCAYMKKNLELKNYMFPPTLTIANSSKTNNSNFPHSSLNLTKPSVSSLSQKVTPPTPLKKSTVSATISSLPKVLSPTLFSEPHLIKSPTIPSKPPPTPSSSSNILTNDLVQPITPSTFPSATVLPSSNSENHQLPVTFPSHVSATSNLAPHPPLPTANYRRLNDGQLKLAIKNVTSGAGGDSVFVRNVLEMVFDEAVLLESSAQGKKPNNRKDVEPRPGLDVDGLSYVRGLLKARIEEEMKIGNPEINFVVDEKKDPRMKKFISHVNGKISAVRKAVYGVEKKRSNKESNDTNEVEKPEGIKNDAKKPERIEAETAEINDLAVDGEDVATSSQMEL